jgi:methyl-accepting chemotaxis protein
MKLRIVMVVIILPLLALAAFFASQTITVEQGRLAVAKSSTVRANEQIILNDLIHELQKERGNSAGLIASSGGNFAGDLAQQWQATDRFVSPLAQINVIASERLADFGRAAAALDELSGFRSDVQNLRVSVPYVAGYYTRIINDFMLAAYPLSYDNEGEKLSALQASPALLAVAKERAGLEQAMGSTGLSTGFSMPVYQTFLQHVGAQQALLSETAKRLNSTSFNDALYASAEYAALQRAREMIVRGTESGDYGTLMGAQWIQIPSSWIDILRDAENEKLLKSARFQHQTKCKAMQSYSTRRCSVHCPFLPLEVSQLLALNG